MSRSSYALFDVNSVIDSIKDDHDFKRAKSELNLRPHQVASRGNNVCEPELPPYQLRDKLRSQARSQVRSQSQKPDLVGSFESHQDKQYA
jgi:hypothetical protein